MPAGAPQESKSVAAASLPADTFLTVSASPWAMVMAVQDSTGKAVALPGGEQATPLRVDGLPAGTYQVELRTSAGDQKHLQCGISATQHLCLVDFGVPNVSSLLKGAHR